MKVGAGSLLRSYNNRHPSSRQRKKGIRKVKAMAGSLLRSYPSRHRPSSRRRRRRKEGEGKKITGEKENKETSSNLVKIERLDGGANTHPAPVQTGRAEQGEHIQVCPPSGALQWPRCEWLLVLRPEEEEETAVASLYVTLL